MNQDPNTQSAEGAADEPAKTFAPEPLEFIPVDTVDQFAQTMTQWHTHRKSMVVHMREIPESATVEFKGVEYRLTGDFRSGYQLGIDMALAQLGTLPFGVEFEEAPEGASDHEGSTED